MTKNKELTLAEALTHFGRVSSGQPIKLQTVEQVSPDLAKEIRMAIERGVSDETVRRKETALKKATRLDQRAKTVYRENKFWQDLDEFARRGFAQQHARRILSPISDLEVARRNLQVEQLANKVREGEGIQPKTPDYPLLTKYEKETGEREIQPGGGGWGISPSRHYTIDRNHLKQLAQYRDEHGMLDILEKDLLAPTVREKIKGILKK